MTPSRTVRLGAVGALLGLALLTMGCEVRGGGYLPPGLFGLVNYSGKASFSFTLTCADRGGEPVVRGQLEYTDSSAGIAIHAVADSVVFPEDRMPAACREFQEGELRVAHFSGVYRPQRNDRAIPDSQEQGRFQLQVHDFGEPGIDRDGFLIQLLGGTYTGYTRGGIIAGGNIQVR